MPIVAMSAGGYSRIRERERGIIAPLSLLRLCRFLALYYRGLGASDFSEGKYIPFGLSCLICLRAQGFTRFTEHCRLCFTHYARRLYLNPRFRDYVFNRFAVEAFARPLHFVRAFNCERVQLLFQRLVKGVYACRFFRLR